MSNSLEAPPNEWIARRSYFAWLVIGTTCIGAFIGQLDASIVQLALPVLEREFDSGLSAASWVAIGYLLGFAALLSPFARLSETTGRKRLYICGYLLFTLASALCGLAPDLSSLIAFRVVQGIGGSLLGANSVIILVKAAGPARRGRAMGIFAAAQAVGVGAGPAVGGLLVSTLGWQWVFWAAVPFGLAGAITAWLVLPQSERVPAKAEFDWRGTLLLCPALAAVLIVLSEVHSWGGTALYTMIGIVIAVSLLALFIRQERIAPTPLIDLSLLLRPAFASGILGIMLSYGMLYGMFFLMSFAFVRGAQLTPIEAGLRLAIIPVTLGLVAPVAGMLSERIAARTLTLAGMAACAAGLLLMSEALRTGLSSSAQATIALILFGAGLGLYISPNNSATLAAAPPESSGVAGGLLNLLRVFGTSIGVAAATSVLAWRLAVRTGKTGSLSAVPSELFFDAAGEAMFLLLVFAVLAGIASLVRPPVS
jgi:EmrB/QacA subfamily drug resistance transporter